MEKFVFIGGPCVIEDEKLIKEVASFLKTEAAKYDIDFYFKASFDKANRSSIDSYRGPGLSQGLDLLAKIKSDLKVKILSDIHSADQIQAAAQVLDFIQIPAFLCRQTDLIVGCAQSGKPTNVKKGQFLSPWETRHIIQKFRSAGGTELFLTERGTTFGYNNLVVDFRSIPIMQSLGVPVIFDATHSCQLPGGMANQSGGTRQYSRHLAAAAAACRVDGLFMEVHPCPDDALCDKATVLPFHEVSAILQQIMQIREVV